LAKWGRIFAENLKRNVMKLAEALSIRADLQKRIAQLKDRLKNNTKIQEGDVPIENPDELWLELDSNLTQLEDLIYRINVTNMHTLHNGQTLTQLIAAKDVLTLRVSSMREVLKHTSEREDRYGRLEIKYICTIDVAALRRKVDSYSRQLRELDVAIQSLNWAVELE
jgi:exosome complex RNA-binding protein Rrp4